MSEKKFNISHPEVIYLLGAGFSKPAGFPLINEFEEYFKKNYDFIKGKCDIQKYNKIINLLSKNDNIENLLYNSKNEDKKLLIEAIWLTINACCISFAERKKNFILYEKFLERILKENAAIITLNYDTVMEIVLDSYQIDSVKTNLNIIVFDYYIPDLENPEYLPIIPINNRSFMKGLEKRIAVLKLHGAFNLFYCHNCGFAYIADNFAGTHPGICKECRIPVEVAIVPPEVSKNIGKFEKMWHEAANFIKNANKLIFIGLNFNESDKNFIDLIRNNLFYNKEVIIINYSYIFTEKEKTKWIDKFYSLFSIKIKGENIFLNGFENWV